MPNRKKKAKVVPANQEILTPEADPTSSTAQSAVPAVTPQESTKTVLKIADRPHYVSIVLSTIALIISLMSWWESRSSRVSNQSSNRAVVYAVELEEIGDDRYDGHDYKLTVKNFGRSPATDITVSNTVIALKHYPTSQDYPTDVFVAMLEDVAPSYQKEFVVPFIRGRGENNEMPEREEGEEIYLIGVLNYLDEPSGVRYYQKWCFKLGTNFGEHYIEPEALPKYQPCPVSF